MFKKKKFWVSAVSVVLVFATVFYFIGTHFQKWAGSTQSVRTVHLNREALDYQSVLADFDNAELTVDDNVADFVGYKTIDASIFEIIDNLSLEETESVIGGSIRYHFTYDVESNVVTIEAEATLPDGQILVDEIKGVGFYNNYGEIDAVMNIDGEGVLLSEMRNAGMIQNCGWFSNLIKAVAVVAAVVAVVAVVAAVVVVTAGTATPALVAAGVGVVATTSTTAIAGTTLTAAAIAAGVAVVATATVTIDSTLQNIGYDASTKTYTDNSKEIAKRALTISTATLAEITMESCYYFAYLASDRLVITSVPLNYIEAYAVIVGIGLIKLNKLSVNLSTAVTNYVKPQPVIDFIDSLKGNTNIKKDYLGIYTIAEIDAAKLAYASGAIIKDSIITMYSETHDSTVGSKYYYHFHDAGHLIHIWYGNAI
ncbi:MAG: hypothetical protein LBE09_00675 [Christensenellaceae bacterium]|jgi:hypothetical protein|nr:hypothetical protein [Christensenellaceae bacterium]